MGFFTKDRPQRTEPEWESAAAKRVARLPTSDLVPWAETCLYTVGRYLTEWTKTGNPDALAEATQGAKALQIVMAEINARDAV